jgi:CRISPR-associated endonuclease/helicase Cas3
LKVAQAKGLRHIFVVLPYVSIVKQSVRVYRDALVLRGENPSEIVAEHDHQADFADVDARHLATLWRAPIIVTTSVQFFETIGAAHPARLRKLHELPGSAVFVDEAHAALPAHIWPQMWLWLDEWASSWSGHVVLASGSLPRFWDLPEFVDPPRSASDIPDLLPERLRAELSRSESRRIQVRRRQEPLTLPQLVEFVAEHPGPRLVIVNTVHSAGVLAHRMHAMGRDVLHISTALTPPDRAKMLDRVRARLDPARHDTDWSLVATSCVEAGVDLSFRTGFRETASTASIVQTSVRVSRGAEHQGAEVWDFRVNDSLLPGNPSLDIPRRVVAHLFESGAFGGAASALTLEAMRLEVTEGQSARAMKLREAERRKSYPVVAELCRVIEADTRFVVIDMALADELRAGKRVAYSQLLAGSVQIWSTRTKKMPVRPLVGEADDPRAIFEWVGRYDPDLLGYMADVIDQLDQTFPVYIV